MNRKKWYTLKSEAFSGGETELFEEKERQQSPLGKTQVQDREVTLGFYKIDSAPKAWI